jgi:hypothetical protein
MEELGRWNGKYNSSYKTQSDLVQLRNTENESRIHPLETFLATTKRCNYGYITMNNPAIGQENSQKVVRRPTANYQISRIKRQNSRPKVAQAILKFFVVLHTVQLHVDMDSNLKWATTASPSRSEFTCMNVLSFDLAL